MRYIFFLSSFHLFFLVLATGQNTEKSFNIVPVESGQLSESDQRKFDFFLFEGAREKMLNNTDNAIADYVQCYTINKFSPVVLYELARLMNTKISDNISFMETAVSIEPNNVFYLQYLANLYFQAGQNTKGINTYIRIYELNKDDDEFTYTLARTAGYMGDFPNALKYFDILEQRLGVNYSISAGKVEVFDKFKKVKEAIKEYKKLIKLYPRNTEYLTMLGQYYMANGMMKEAIAIFEPLSKDSGSAGEANLSLALIKLAMKDSLSALGYFQIGLKDSGLPSQRKMTYIKSLKLKDSYAINLLGDRTIEFMDYVLRSDSKDIEAPLYLAFYYEIDKKSSADAIKYFELATGINPSEYDPWKFLLSSFGASNRYKDIITYGKTALIYFPEDPTILYYYAVACSIDGKDSIAIDSFEKALLAMKGLDAENSSLAVGIYGGLGDCYYRVDSVQKSFAAYEQVLKLNPNNVVVLNNYSYFLAEKGLDLVKAEQMSAKVIQLEPGNPTYLDTYAWVLFKLKRYTEAKFIIERAMDNGGDSSDVIIEHYGDILALTGSPVEAIKYWKLSLDKGNSSKTLPVKINKGIYIE